MNDRNWGGKREGAGRKKGDIKYVTFSVSLSEEEAMLLEKMANNEELTVSRFISKHLHLKETLNFLREKKQKK